MKKNKQHRSHRRALHGSDSEVMDVGTFFVMDQMRDEIEPAGDAFPVIEDTINVPHTPKPHEVTTPLPDSKEKVVTATKDVYGKIIDVGSKGIQSIKSLLRKAG